MKLSVRPWGIVVTIGLILSIALSGIAYAALGDRLLGRGSAGPDVRELQTRLVQLGYGLGPIDGRLGPRTEDAIRRFQRDQGLRVNGLAETPTINELKRLTGQSTNASGRAIGNSNVNTYLLARCVNAEARGEPFLGQIAVAAVILNRTHDPAYPDSIPDIIYQPGAFSCVQDGQINLPPSASSMRAAQEALTGYDPTGGAIYYFNPAKTRNKYVWSRPEIKQIGNHIFTK